MRRKVRGLVRLIERTRRAVVYSHFTDEIGEISESRLRGVALGTDRGRFASKARIYLRSHEDSPVVRRLRHHRQIGVGDLESLTEVFLASGIGTREDIAAAAAGHGGLGLFLRSLTGLDREAVRGAFEPFRVSRELTSGQERFLTMLVDFVAANGIVQAGQLYEAPFTAVAPGGPEDVFADADVDALILVLDQIRATAVAV
jgi:type I restriction enzyme R subunit